MPSGRRSQASAEEAIALWRETDHPVNINHTYSTRIELGGETAEHLRKAEENFSQPKSMRYTLISSKCPSGISRQSN